MCDEKKELSHNSELAAAKFALVNLILDTCKEKNLTAKEICTILHIDIQQAERLALRILDEFSLYTLLKYINYLERDVFITIYHRGSREGRIIIGCLDSPEYSENDISADVTELEKNIYQ